MTPKGRALALALAAGIAAGAAQADTADSCGMAAIEGYIGQPVGAAQPHLGQGPVRIIHPGDMVTQDYNPARLNIELDEAGNITGLRCG